MPKNRVERLEATVKELESTVEGLTEELVESKERIRVLEAELDTEIPTRVPERRQSADAEVEGDETPEAAQNDVAEAAAEADGVEDEEEALEGEPEDSGTDDIIVA
ncbi:DUF7518 family protein [Natronosalvus rutilus]|uniref:Chromosome segregation protein SMC n=1 Tax=Natronosalvus rutilus TaxID=2953753 RepID=A0A9E7SV33_9EURY|nr:hypothetical protein [Natronosalvus rutilus]UTF53487.1 hypothetical protein NGM29_17220 [Natronosalvus rutilus]